MRQWEHCSWGDFVEGTGWDTLAREVFETDTERTVAVVGTYEDAEAICAWKAREVGQ